jgi:arylsulfatase A-like enzyme
MKPTFLSILLPFICLVPLHADDSMPTERPNIVWLTTEDNSVHYLRLYSEGGAAMPTVERLAENGIVFNNAFSNAPVCSTARSTIISGCYGPRVFAQFHRRSVKVPVPEGLRLFPWYLRQAGYYTTNNSKEDYNFIKGKDVWDDSSDKASYRI